MFAKKAVTEEQKKIAEHKQKNDLEGMEFILDHVIFPSLAQNVNEKYKIFIKAMEENNDEMLARKLGMLVYYRNIINFTLAWYWAPPCVLMIAVCVLILAINICTGYVSSFIWVYVDGEGFSSDPCMYISIFVIESVKTGLIVHDSRCDFSSPTQRHYQICSRYTCACSCDVIVRFLMALVRSCCVHLDSCLAYYQSLITILHFWSRRWW